MNTFDDYSDCKLIVSFICYEFLYEVEFRGKFEETKDEFYAIISPVY